MKTAQNSNKQSQPANPTNTKSSPVIITSIEHKQSAIIKSIPNRSYIPSQLVAKNAISTILHRVKQQTFANNCLKTKMTPYSGSFAQKNIGQTLRMHFDHNLMQKSLQDDPEPTPLHTDNLIPVATHLEPNNLEKFDKISKISKNQSMRQTNLGRLPRNSTMVSRSQKQLSIPDPKNTTKTSSYIKLNQEDLPKYEVSTDPFVQQLRRQKEAKLKESQQNKKVQKKTNLRDIIKKDQKISYDFNGQIIKIKQNQKGNFVSSSVEGLQNPALAKREKQPKIDVNAINLDINSRKAVDKKALSKKALDIEFSNITSLTPQLEILEGVKFIQGKSVMEKKKKQASITELKKSISTKRFTRNDFERLKSLGDNKSVRGKGDSLPSIAKSETDIDAKNESILGRSVSEVKFEDRSRLSVGNRLNKSTDRMSIENEQLTGMLIEPVHNSAEDDMILRAPVASVEDESKMIGLSHIDKANLNYIKTGSVGKIELPKISYRINANQNLKQPHPITLLESKAKLKGKRKQNEFERLRKHFEDKLRT